MMREFLTFFSYPSTNQSENLAANIFSFWDEWIMVKTETVLILFQLEPVPIIPFPSLIPAIIYSEWRQLDHVFRSSSSSE